MDINLLSKRFCDYSVLIKGYSKDTIRRYRNVIDFYRRFSKITCINEVNEENIRDLFYKGRIERNWSTNTFIIYRKTLMIFFKWCIKEGYMDKNPISNIEVPRLEKKLPIKINKQNALKILEVVQHFPYDYSFLRHRNYAIFSMFIFTGLRKQELLNLKYTDVDIDNLTIFVRKGKGSKDRIIPMNYTLAQALQKYKNDRKRLNKTNPEFFSSLRGNIGFTENGLKKLIEQVRKSSGVYFTAHKLRHTFATLMLEGGCDIYSLSKMMGHSDISTTTIYLSTTAEHLRAQVVKHPLGEPS